MRRSSISVLSLLTVFSACDASNPDTRGSDTDPGSAVELEFEGESPFLPDFDLDTGWQPAQGPAGVRLTLGAGGGVSVRGRGLANGDEVVGIDDSGELTVQGELLIELSARLSVSTIEYEGVLESFGYEIPEQTERFDPFALEDTTRLETTLPASELGVVPIPSVPGASVRLEITGGQLDTAYTTTCASSDTEHAQVTGDLSMGGTVNLAATIEVEIPVVGTETFGPFEIEAPIPEVTRAIDLGTREVLSGDETSDQGVCAGSSMTTDPTIAGTSGMGDTDMSTSGSAPTSMSESDTHDGSGSTGDMTPETTGSDIVECSTFDQDCPEGDKCMPWADGGTTWNAHGCFPVDPSPAGMGESCTFESSTASGFDTCAEGLMCWRNDAQSTTGQCRALCAGSPEVPLCPSQTSCVTTNDGWLNVCFPSCDPLGNDCSGSEGCYPFEATYACLPDSSGNGGANGDECEGVNSCDPGLVCIGIAGSEDCSPDAAGCCTPFCDLDGDDVCQEAQTCYPLYPEGRAPAGHEDVGICVVL